VAATVAALGVFAATATPAHAVTTVDRVDTHEIKVKMTDCSPTAFSGACHVFEINGTFSRTNGLDTVHIDVEAKDVTIVGGGLLLDFGPNGSTGSATVGTVRVNGRTGKVSVTAVMACASPVCDVSGPVTIKVALSKALKSDY